MIRQKSVNLQAERTFMIGLFGLISYQTLSESLWGVKLCFASFQAVLQQSAIQDDLFILVKLRWIKRIEIQYTVQLNFIQKIYGTKTFSLIKKMSNSCEKTHIYDICFILKKTQTQSQSFGITSKICHKRVWTGPFMLKIYDTSLYWLSCIEYSATIVFKNLGWPRQDLNLLPHGRTRTCNSQPRLVRFHYVSWRSTSELRGR